MGKEGDVDTAAALKEKKAIALYFSGHWCPPCKGFTPKLAEWYESNLKAKGLEVVFVSSDRDESSFKEYFGEMPWLALPYSERAVRLLWIKNTKSRAFLQSSSWILKGSSSQKRGVQRSPLIQRGTKCQKAGSQRPLPNSSMMRRCSDQRVPRRKAATCQALCLVFTSAPTGALHAAVSPPNLQNGTRRA